MVSQYKQAGPEQLSIRLVYLRVIYEVLVQDPNRVNHLNLSDDQAMDALGLISVIQSGDNDAVTLGVNLV